MATVISDFRGRFRRKAGVGDEVGVNGVVGQIFSGNIWQNQRTPFGGRIEGLLEDGTMVNIGDVVSDITVLIAIAADIEPAEILFESSRAGAARKSPVKSSSKKRPAAISKKARPEKATASTGQKPKRPPVKKATVTKARAASKKASAKKAKAATKHQGQNAKKATAKKRAAKQKPSVKKIPNKIA